jgi:Zn-dependent protease with chaperone function
MDFFEHQEKAKNKTGLLVFLFGVAVMLIVVAVYSTLAIFFRISPVDTGDQWESLGLLKYWDPQLFLWVAGGTLLVILSGSLYKIKLLSDTGGAGVAELFDGDYVKTQTQNPAERRLINIVEEMAIASGISVPRIYLMEGRGINAFAAGFSVNTAVIGVTQGCLDKLTRQELQGVIAHEFSHIINGDMKNNIRLIGILHGILLINIIGYTLLRAAGRSGGRSDGRIRAVFFVFGVMLMIIGYLGVFFGRLIKASISRQREFLADATAVQYTRDPEGIHGALGKIFADQEGSTVDHPSSEEVSHLFFSNAGKRSAFGQLFDMLSTHPPLKKRMKRIIPNGTIRAGGAKTSLQGQVGTSREGSSASNPDPKKAGGNKHFLEEKSPGGNGTFATTASLLATVGGAMNAERFGSLSREGVEKTSEWMRDLPPPLGKLLETPRGAAAIILSTLLTRMPITGQIAGQSLLDNVPKEIWNMAQDATPYVENLQTEEIFPLIELSLMAVRELPRKDLRSIYEHSLSFSGLNGRETLFDYMISSFIRARVFEMISPRAFDDPRAGDLLRYLRPMRVILSSLARYGHPESDDEAEKSYHRAIKTLEEYCVSARAHRSFGRLAEGGLVRGDDKDLRNFDEALFSMKDAAGPLKKAFLEACYDCISRDKVVLPDEFEMFRAIAGVLDCPTPPLLTDGH